MPYLQFISAVRGLVCWLRDTFTAADGTVIDTHTPDRKVGDFEWHGTAEITSNRIYGPVSGASIQGYKSAYTALGVEPPFKITMVALCTATGGEYSGVTFENADNSTNIVVELGGAGALTVTVLDPVTEVNDIATGLALDTEHTIEVVFEAQRFQTVINGVPRSPVSFVGDIPVDMVAVTPAIASADSYISSIAVCETKDEIEGDPHFGDVKLLMRGNGANGATTFTDSSASPVTPAAVGNAQISTAQSKFGGASMAFDGVGDTIRFFIPPKLQIGTADFTIEGWVWMQTAGTHKHVLQFGESGAQGGFTININTSNCLEFDTFTASTIQLGTNVAVSAQVWTHFAVTRQGTTVRGFLGGTLLTTTLPITVTDSLCNGVGTERVYLCGESAPWAGYLDDVRVTIGVARYTASFTVPNEQFPDV